MKFLNALLVFPILGFLQAAPGFAQSVTQPNNQTDASPNAASTELAANENQPTTYSIFMLVKTTDQWLALSPQERFAFLDNDINPILEENPTVEMSFFDTEGFNSRVTDVIVWKSQSLDGYQAVVEALRESDFWGKYFEVVEILPGIENAYASYYDVNPY